VAPARRLWVLLSLCAFLSRALIPVGFMPTAGANGGLSLGFCPSYGAVPGAGALHHPDSMVHHDHGTHDNGGAADHHATCVFAASAHAAPNAAHGWIFVAVRNARRLSIADSQLAEPLGNVPRAQSPRAPPALI
jgi:hypothetical protein